MPLQVWLPLLGNTNNQGLSNVTVTNNNATVDNSGKLGKCYAFSGSSQYLRIDKKLIKTSEYSISFWMYTTDVSSNHCIFSTRNINSGAVNIYSLPAGIRFDTSTSANWATGFKPTINTWYHLTLVQDATTKYIYVNGVLNNSIAGTTNLSQVSDVCTIGCEHINGSSIGTYFPGKLNDVRIYDHALSPKEIKLLSQGLVCHYQLNDKPCANLYVGTRDFSGYWVGSGNWTTDTSQTYDGFTVKQRTGTWGGLAQNVTATKGDIFTISFYAKVTAGGTVASVHRSNLGNVTTGLSLLDGNFVSSNYWITTDGSITSWKYCWATLEIVSEDITYLQWRIENSQSNKTMWITRFKLEKGSKATAWMPNSADAEYTQLGYDKNIIYDSSGYNYHGQTNTEATVATNSPRNSSCTIFGSTNNPKITSLNTSWLSSITSGSISWWEYCTTTGNHLICSSDTSHYIGAGSSTTRLYNGNVGTYGLVMYRDGVQTDTITYNNHNSYCPNVFHKNGEWHHFVLTGINLSSWTNFYINGYDSTWPVNAYLSDVRIYSTTLSLDDAKALYNAPVSVANNGTMITQGEFYEHTNT